MNIGKSVKRVPKWAWIASGGVVIGVGAFRYLQNRNSTAVDQSSSYDSTNPADSGYPAQSAGGASSVLVPPVVVGGQQDDTGGSALQAGFLGAFGDVLSALTGSLSSTQANTIGAVQTGGDLTLGGVNAGAAASIAGMQSGGANYDSALSAIGSLVSGLTGGGAPASAAPPGTVTAPAPAPAPAPPPTAPTAAPPPAVKTCPSGWFGTPTQVHGCYTPSTVYRKEDGKCYSFRRHHYQDGYDAYFDKTPASSSKC